jgi:transposase
LGHGVADVFGELLAQAHKGKYLIANKGWGIVTFKRSYASWLNPAPGLFAKLFNSLLRNLL